MSLSMSTIMPIGGLHPYLDEAIASALAELPSDGELVLVWDGIKPETAFEDDLRIISVTLEQGLGTPKALNAGIRASRGEVIVRLDSDDWARPTRARRLLDYLEGHPEVCCVGSSAILIDEAGKEIGHYPVPTSPEDVRHQLLRKNALIHSSVAYRRAAFDKIGGYNEACLRMQDYDLFLRLSHVGDLANLPEELVCYRVHGSMSSRSNSPWQPYTREILRQRRALAKHMGSSRIAQLIRDSAWFAAQVLRFHGIRKPAHAQKVKVHP